MNSNERYKLPQGYKRWPLLCNGEKCGHHVGTGEVPAVIKSCGALAIAIFAPYHDDELLGFVPLCLPCYAKVQRSVLTREEWKARTAKREPVYNQCDWCGSGAPLFEHVYLDGIRRLCERCKADAIDEEDYAI